MLIKKKKFSKELTVISAVKKYFQDSQLLENYYIGVCEVSGKKISLCY